MTAAATCRHWIGDAGRYCDTTDRVRLYLPGPRCPEHTPAAIAGRAEPPSNPPESSWWVRPDGSTIPPSPIATSRLLDDRAVASGKRRSSPDRYAAARAAEQDRRDHEQQTRRGQTATAPDMSEAGPACPATATNLGPSTDRRHHRAYHRTAPAPRG